MILNVNNLPEFKSTDKIVLVSKITKPASFLHEFPKTLKEWEIMKEQNKLPKLTDQLTNWFWRMIKASILNNGIGVAAPQIGLQKRMFVIQESEKNFRVYIHPSFSVDSGSKLEIEEEGCLSVPKYSFSVPRNTTILASWFEFDENGILIFKNELLEGMLARIFQHELDHCLGENIINRAAGLNREQKRSILKNLK